MSEWKIRFGTAGTSDSFTAMGYKNSLDIPAYTEKMGLDAFEYQCGHGVRLGLDKAAKMAALAAPKISAASGAGPAASAAARGRIAAALVRKTRAIIVLKGAGTLVAAEGRQTYTNTTGNPGMATAGSGDVLSGIITGLAGQRSQVGTGTALDFAPGNPAGAVPDGTSVPGTEATAGQAAKPARIGAFEAALAGVYIHGLAGDLAARELGEYGVTAGDLALYTAYAMKKILSEV